MLVSSALDPNPQNIGQIAGQLVADSSKGAPPRDGIGNAVKKLSNPDTQSNDFIGNFIKDATLPKTPSNNIAVFPPLFPADNNPPDLREEPAIGIQDNSPEPIPGIQPEPFPTSASFQAIPPNVAQIIKEWATPRNQWGLVTQQDPTYEIYE